MRNPMIKWRIVSGLYNSIHEIVGKVTIEIEQDGVTNPVLSCYRAYHPYTEVSTLRFSLLP